MPPKKAAPVPGVANSPVRYGTGAFRSLGTAAPWRPTRQLTPSPCGTISRPHRARPPGRTPLHMFAHHPHMGYKLIYAHVLLHVITARQ